MKHSLFCWLGPLSVMLALFFTVPACSPRVELAAPTQPIHIKLDVKIEHEIMIRVERQLDEIISPDSGLF